MHDPSRQSRSSSDSHRMFTPSLIPSLDRVQQRVARCVAPAYVLTWSKSRRRFSSGRQQFSCVQTLYPKRLLTVFGPAIKCASRLAEVKTAWRHFLEM